MKNDTDIIITKTKRVSSKDSSEVGITNRLSQATQGRKTSSSTNLDYSSPSRLKRKQARNDFFGIITVEEENEEDDTFRQKRNKKQSFR